MRFVLKIWIILLPICANCEMAKGTDQNSSLKGESLFETEERYFEECWPEKNITCITTLVLRPLEDIWIKDEVKLMDSVFIEQKNGNSGRRYGGDVEKALHARALRLDIGSWGSLHVAQSAENSDSLEIAFDMVSGSPDGRGKRSRMWKIALPLALGFKVTAMVIFAIAAIKIFLLKTLVVSKVALLAAGFLLLKKLLNSMRMKHHSSLYQHYPLPYYHEPQYGLESAGVSDYGVYGYGTSETGDADLQAHSSRNVANTVQAVPVMASSGSTNHTASRRYGTRQRPAMSLVKSRLNPVSIVAYRKVAHKGRSAGNISPDIH